MKRVADMPAGDLRDVLGRTLEGIWLLISAQQLRDWDAVDPEANDRRPVLESELPADPWESGDAAADAIEHGRQLFEALADSRTVGELLRGLTTLEEGEALLIVFERALCAMIERTRPRALIPERAGSLSTRGRRR